MTERDMELADECQHPYSEHRIDLKKFAELIRADEREACADIVDNADTPDCGGWTSGSISNAIRARGKA